MITTYTKLLQMGKDSLEKKGIREAELDAWYLLSEVLGLSREQYLINRNVKKNISEKQIKEYEEKIAIRAKRIPLQHIIGSQEFMGLSFEVNNQVLIPRQDTEIIAEEVLKEKKQTVLDVCTGSGCIAISLYCLGNFLNIDALDVSETALCMAQKNARKLHADINFIKSDLFENIHGIYDILVSNPPYVSEEEFEKLEPEVKDNEPHLALYSPEKGLYFYKRISKEGRKYLKTGGRIYYEIGCTQADAVSDILRENGYSSIEIIKDLAGKNRVIKAVKTELGGNYV